MATIDRSTFMGGSAALIAAANAVPADAQSADFGHPHPPIVPETDPAITTQHGTLTPPDATAHAYILLRYCPPTSNSALVICPSEQQRTASTSTSNTF